MEEQEEMELENNHPSLNIEYFDLKQAISDIGDAYGAKEKSIAGAKLVGKTLFNSALFAGKTAVNSIKETIEQKEILQDESDEHLENIRKDGSSAQKRAANIILNERNMETD